MLINKKPKYLPIFTSNNGELGPTTTISKKITTSGRGLEIVIKKSYFLDRKI